MALVANRTIETGIAIRDLVCTTGPEGAAAGDDLSTAEVMVTVPTDQREAFILDHDSLQRVFAAIPDDQPISEHVAAACLDRSLPSLLQYLREQYGADERGWKEVLGQEEPEALDRHGRFRWSFVRALVDRWEVRQNVVSSVRGGLTTTASLEALSRRHRFLLDKDNNVIAAWGQGGVDAELITSALDAQGSVTWLTAVEALLRPWSSPRWRKPWADAVADVLEKLSQSTVHGDAPGVAA